MIRKMKNVLKAVMTMILIVSMSGCKPKTSTKEEIEKIRLTIVEEVLTSLFTSPYDCLTDLSNYEIVCSSYDGPGVCSYEEQAGVDIDICIFSRLLGYSDSETVATYASSTLSSDINLNLHYVLFIFDEVAVDGVEVWVYSADETTYKFNMTLNIVANEKQYSREVPGTIQFVKDENKIRYFNLNLRNLRDVIEEVQCCE